MRNRRWIHVLLLTFIASIPAAADEPDLPQFVCPAPSPAPALPAEFGPFDPPTKLHLNPAGPVVAAAGVAAGPDQSAVLTGDFLQTQFRSFAQTTRDNADLSYAQIQMLTADGVIVTLPPDEPPHSMVLIWPLRGGKAGAPIALNRTLAKWLLPDSAAPGDAVSVYGRNLTSGAPGAKSWVYLQPSAGGAGRWLLATAASLYKIDITIPTDLPPGTYHVFAHNGLGNRLGFSSPLSLTVQAATPFNGPTLNVKDFGAAADGNADDGPAIQKAINAARNNGTVYFPAGIYRVSDEQLLLKSNLRIRGDGPRRTTLRFTGDIAALKNRFNRGEFALALPDHTRHVQFHSLTLQYDGPPTHGALINQRFCQDVTYDDVALIGRALFPADPLGSSGLTITHCVCAGAPILLLNIHDVRIEQTEFQEAYEPDSPLDIWNAHDISITGCTFRNYNPAAKDISGWGLGRVVENNCVWGSIYNEYFAGNTSINLGTLRPGNTGEHINLEGAVELYHGPPLSAGSDFVTIPPATPKEGYVVIVTAGPGVGQMRSIQSFTPDGPRTKLTLDRPWNLTPDQTSRLEVASTVYDSVFCDNTFHCQPDSPTAANLQAAAAFEVWTGGYNLVCDGNTAEGMLHGVVLVSARGENPCYFIDVLNNQLRQNRGEGIDFWPAEGAEYQNYIGVVVRGNRIDKAELAGISLYSPGRSGGAAALSTIEHNTVLNVPIGMRVWSDRDVLAYRNTFDCGAAAWPGSAAITYHSSLSAIVLHDNTYLNFSHNFMTAKR